MRKIILFILLIMLSEYGYSKQNNINSKKRQSLHHTQTDLLAESTPPSHYNNYPYKGYSSTRQEYALTKCYKSDFETIGQITKSGIIARFFSSDKEASEAFGFDISGGGANATFSGSGSFGYSSSSNQKDFTLSYYVGAALIQHIDVDIKSETKQQLFTEQGLLILEKNMQNNVANNTFTEKCGDKIYTKIKRGATVISKLNIVFSSKEDKESFNASAKAGISVAELSGKLESASKNSESSLRIVVETQAYGVNKNVLAAFSGGISACNPASLQSCVNIIKGVEKFISSDDPKNSFRASASNQTFIPLEADLIDVSSLGLIQIESLSTVNKEAQKKFVNVKAKYNTHKTTFWWMKEFYTFGNDNQFRSVVDQTINEINAILDLTTNYGNKCFNQPSQCQTQWSSFKSEAKSHLDTINKLKPEYNLVRNMYRLPIFDVFFNEVKLGAAQDKNATIPLYASSSGITTPYFIQNNNKILEKYSINNIPGSATSHKNNSPVIQTSKLIFSKSYPLKLIVFPGMLYNDYEMNSFIALGDNQVQENRFIIYTPANGIHDLDNANVSMKNSLLSGQPYSLNVFLYRGCNVGDAMVTSLCLVYNQYIKAMDHRQITLNPEPNRFYPGELSFEIE